MGEMTISTVDLTEAVEIDFRGGRITAPYGLPLMPKGSNEASVEDFEFALLAQAIAKGYDTFPKLAVYVVKLSCEGRLEGLDCTRLRRWLEWLGSSEVTW